MRHVPAGGSGSGLGVVLGIVGALYLGACGRDFNLPVDASTEGPRTLGRYAGYYRLSVTEMANLDGTPVPRQIPVAGTAAAQHLILPQALREAVGGNPVVLILSEPAGVDLDGGLRVDPRRNKVLYGSEDESGRVSGKVGLSRQIEAAFELHPAPGEGVLRLTVGGCPGRPVFSGDRTLNLERICRFESSRSGVYAGCEASCDRACDPAVDPEVHYHALGFTPLSGLPYDFVAAVSYWRDTGDRWVPNFSMGGYDRFMGEGFMVMRRFDEDQNHPAGFSLSSNAGFLELDWRRGPQVPDGDLGEDWACEARSIARRAVGGEEAFCDPAAPEVEMRILARWVGPKLLVDLEVGGGTLFRPSFVRQTFEGFTGPLGLAWGASHGVEDLLQVIARAEPSGRVLSPSRVCNAAAFCFDGPTGSTGVSIEAMVKISGTWMVCDGFPGVQTCDTRVPRSIVLPLAAALPVCLLP